MHYIILPFLGLLAAGLHIFFRRQARDPKIILEMVLAYGLAFNFGISGIYAFMGHAFVPDRVAEYIGWPPGSPFQFEVAIATWLLEFSAYFVYGSEGRSGWLQSSLFLFSVLVRLMGI